jgi:8-oxo-dGTP pyrophosphatase MutT (NUDIX family)
MNTKSEKTVSPHYLELCRSRIQLENHLKEKLSNHKQRTFAYTSLNGVDAAVLIPLFFKEGEAYLLFTKRTDKVEHHKGQISFPGGRMDDTDDDLLITALRETEEEVGINPSDITVLGQTDRFLTNTHYLVTPFVGSFDYPYDYQVNYDEIDRLIEVPLSHLLHDDDFQIKPYEIKGQTWQIHYYDYDGDTIWGVTGFLLSNFLSIVFDLPRQTSQPA